MIHSIPISIPYRNIDTDMILSADFLKTTNKKGLGKHLFERVRDLEVFKNFRENTASQIIITLDNFGCGSSREHAVWALLDYGIRVVIAPSFSNIFYNNAVKNQLLPVVLPLEAVEKLLNFTENITVDLENQQVKSSANKELCYSFDMEPFWKKCLLEQKDQLDLLLSYQNDIRTYDKKKAENLFFDISKI